MINFKKIEYKNFLSVGNAPIEIDLTRNPHTLITGTNGNGKSTLLSALTFALFGKPLKSITKPKLVNSINGKNLEVKIDFDIGADSYKVIRGIKPNTFEVYKNGELVDQTAVRDYQEYLERVVLKTNFRAFTQTSIISIENYVPFMQLKTGERREFIEELLDLNVFSTMNTLLKQQVSDTKLALTDADSNITHLKQVLLMQKKHVEDLEKEKHGQIDSLKSKINQYESDIKQALDESAAYKTDYDKLDAELSEVSADKSKLEKYPGIKLQLQESGKKLATKKEFYHTADNCPTCKQKIDSDHKHQMLSEAEAKELEIAKAIESLAKKIDDLDSLNAKITDILAKQKSLTIKMVERTTAINQLNRSVREAQDEIQKIEASTSSTDDKKLEMKETARKLKSYMDRKVELTKKKAYQDMMLVLLKDTGIKARIIKQYIPVINKLVNTYLGMLDFFVSFELDENFDEKIKSRHRDDFTYFNFSAGEQQRIDLALMFTFREISRLKNSFNSNLLMMDEVLDSSLDAAGIENVMDIFASQSLKNSNIFVISHRNKDTLADRFTGLIELDKVNGFTKIMNQQ
ncbi:recombination endonuclease subunit [Synechococcus phage BUCT-ZZ01]|nr:recombination endonuclease subunit [Synechococcus phage BUCT-ZZ01]